MNAYRLNLRLNPNDPRERRAAEYLRQLPTSWNRFVVNAILSAMEEDHLEETLRLILREELQSVTLSAPTALPEQTVPPVPSAEEQNRHVQNVLEDLSFFG